jgi:hypothetical protein
MDRLAKVLSALLWCHECQLGLKALTALNRLSHPNRAISADFRFLTMAKRHHGIVREVRATDDLAKLIEPLPSRQLKV